MKQKSKSHRRFCSNCNLPRFKPTDYCPNCGQKNTNGKLSIRELLSEFSDATFNIDSRIFKTIVALFIPGKLTNEYFKGRHRTYLHPLRFFLIMTLGLIASATFQIKNGDFFGFEDELEEARKDYHETEFLLNLDSLRKETKAEFPQKIADTAIDSLFNKITHNQEYGTYDSIELLKASTCLEWNSREVCKKDVLTLSPDSLISLYQVTGFADQYMMRQQVRIVRKGGNFGYYVIGNISWMVFLMMPFLAIILKIIYIRRDYLYVEHLIFSFHAHCFSFLMYIIMINFGQYNSGLVIPSCFFAIIIHLFFSMKNVYKQGRIKTFLKFVMTGMAYLFILSFAIALTLLASAALF